MPLRSYLRTLFLKNKTKAHVIYLRDRFLEIFSKHKISRLSYPLSDTQQNMMNDKCVVSAKTTPNVLEDSKLQNCEISKSYSEKCAQNEENIQIENVPAIYTEMSDEDNTSERTSSVDLENQLLLATESSVDCGKKFAYIIAFLYKLYPQNNNRKNIWKRYPEIKISSK